MDEDLDTAELFHRCLYNPHSVSHYHGSSLPWMWFGPYGKRGAIICGKISTSIYFIFDLLSK